jgi:hypothetical protein
LQLTARMRPVAPLRSLVVSLVIGSSIFAAACSIGETTYETIKLPVRVKTETRTCESPFVKPDIQKLKACAGGKGHCYDKAKLPIPDSKLTPCEGNEVCVPDKLLLANGKKPKACKFFIADKPGACVSLLVKDVEENKDTLKQDACDADERCIPCINPLDGKDTRICDVPSGVHEADCVGGTAADDLKACCHGMGVCMTEEGAPPDNRENMSRDSCPARHLCAPASMATGKPVKCDVLGMSGVCLDLCFAEMFKATTKVMRSSCGPTEVCMPCVLGASQGMPGCD